jgi:hypothetical protein
VHLGAVDAAALFDDDGEALAVRIGLGEVLAQVLEGLVQPGNDMQAVVAQLGRGRPRREDAAAASARSLANMVPPFRLPSADRLENLETV